MKTVLAAAWLLCLSVACFSAGMLVYGMMRDDNFGEVRLALGPGSDWRESTFRVWRDGKHVLWLNGPRVSRVTWGVSRGTATIAGEETRDFRAGPEWLMLGTFELPRTFSREWKLRARLSEPDDRAELVLRKSQYDPGMGGMMNYAIMLPGSIAGIVALLLAVVRRKAWMIWTTLAAPLAAKVTGAVIFLFRS